MTAQKPEELAPLFTKALNAGDLEGLLALYESDAAFLPEPGKPLTGSVAIRASLQGFLALKPRFTTKSTIKLKSADLAFQSSQWTLEGTGPDGSPVKLGGSAVEILRKQPDGRWLYALDAPFGHG